MKKIYKFESFLESFNNDGEEVELFNEPEIIGDNLESYEIDIDIDEEEDIVNITIVSKNLTYKFQYFIDLDEEEVELTYLVGYEVDNEDDSESFIIDEDSSLYNEIVEIIEQKNREPIGSLYILNYYLNMKYLLYHYL